MIHFLHTDSSEKSFKVKNRKKLLKNRIKTTRQLRRWFNAHIYFIQFFLLFYFCLQHNAYNQIVFFFRFCISCSYSFHSLHILISFTCSDTIYILAIKFTYNFNHILHLFIAYFFTPELPFFSLINVNNQNNFQIEFFFFLFSPENIFPFSLFWIEFNFNGIKHPCQLGNFRFVLLRRHKNRCFYSFNNIEYIKYHFVCSFFFVYFEFKFIIQIIRFFFSLINFNVFLSTK